jgi:hypothetical protein
LKTLTADNPAVEAGVERQRQSSVLGEAQHGVFGKDAAAVIILALNVVRNERPLVGQILLCFISGGHGRVKIWVCVTKIMYLHGHEIGGQWMRVMYITRLFLTHTLFCVCALGRLLDIQPLIKININKYRRSV